MIAEMQTTVPGPRSLEKGSSVVFDNRFEGTNVWDVDGNRYLDLTSAGGTLPFGYVKSELMPLSDCLPDLEGYQMYRFDGAWPESERVTLLGQTILASHKPCLNEQVKSLSDLSRMTAEDTDLLVVRAEYLNRKDLLMIKGWCKQFGVKLLLDERELGLYRSGQPFLMADMEPDFILTDVADEAFGTHEILFSNITLALSGVQQEKVACNYGDKDLTRTINLQSLEMNGLLGDSLSEKTIESIGSFHTLEVGSAEEAERICQGLLQRGIIVSRLATKVVLLPSLYLALGEIVFAVNHIRMVVRNVDEVEVPWV